MGIFFLLIVGTCRLKFQVHFKTRSLKHSCYSHHIERKQGYVRVVNKTVNYLQRIFNIDINMLPIRRRNSQSGIISLETKTRGSVFYSSFDWFIHRNKTGSFCQKFSLMVQLICYWNSSQSQILERLNFDSEPLYLRKFMSYQTHSSTPLTLSSTTESDLNLLFFLRHQDSIHYPGVVMKKISPRHQKMIISVPFLKRNSCTKPVYSHQPNNFPLV